MRNPKIWRTELLSEIRTIADEQELRRLWSGTDSSAVSSFAEEVAHVFDDYDIDGFIAAGRGQSGLGIEQFGALVRFRDCFASYVDSFGSTSFALLDYQVILHDPRWADVVKAAGELMALVDPPV